MYAIYLLTYIPKGLLVASKFGHLWIELLKPSMYRFFAWMCLMYSFLIFLFRISLVETLGLLFIRHRKLFFNYLFKCCLCPNYLLVFFLNSNKNVLYIFILSATILNLSPKISIFMSLFVAFWIIFLICYFSSFLFYAASPPSEAFIYYSTVHF